MSEGEAKRGEEAGLMFKLGWEGGGGANLCQFLVRTIAILDYI